MFAADAVCMATCGVLACCFASGGFSTLVVSVWLHLLLRFVAGKLQASGEQLRPGKLNTVGQD